MMKIYRAPYYKTYLLPALCAILVMALASCSKSKDISFCEGLSLKGDGVNCAIKFYSGDLTAIIKSKKPFGATKIELVIYELAGNKKEKSDSLSVDVKPEDSQAVANLSLNIGGKFRVVASASGENFAEADVEIVDERQ